MIEMIINGQRLDLFKNEVFALSKAISKLGEFNLRHGDVSISYKLPITNKNASILGHVNNLNNQNKTVFKRLEGELLQDNSILSKGFFQVLKINPRKSIEVRFYGGNSEWFDLINDREINGNYPNTGGNPNLKSYDLDYLNHKLDADVIVSSWSNDSGYFYFPLDNGENFNKSDNVFELTDFQCGVFQHTIIENIFDSIGVKLNGSLFNDPLYYNTLVNQPTDTSRLEVSNNVKEFKQIDNVRIERDVYQPLVYSLNDQDPQWDGSVFTSQYDIDTFDLEYYFAGKIIDPGQITITEGILTVKCEWTKNGIPQPDDIRVLSGNGLSNLIGIYRYEYFDLESYNFTDVKVGDTFNFSILNTGYTPALPPGVGYWYTYGADNVWLDYSIQGVSTPFTFDNIIPEINQAKFVKDVMFRHGVISQFEPVTRTLTLNKLQDIENNKVNAVDYSDKIDLSKDPSYDFKKILNGFKKRSKIVYTQDDNDLQMRLFKSIAKTNLGDAVIDIDNDNLTGEGIVYESPFAGTLTEQVFNNNFYLPLARYMVPDNGVFEQQDLKPRLFVKAGLLDVSTISNSYSGIVFNGTQTQIGYAYFAKQSLNSVLDSITDTLSFSNIKQSTTNYIGTTLLEKNYGLYVSILNNPVHLSINLDLKPLDIQKVDFMKPIWLIDSYYYINNISQYKGDGTTTKVELVKL